MNKYLVKRAFDNEWLLCLPQVINKEPDAASTFIGPNGELLIVLTKDWNKRIWNNQKDSTKEK